MMNVVYMVKKSGVKLTKSFDSEFLCRKLVNKLKHSKTCELISYPLFS